MTEAEQQEREARIAAEARLEGYRQAMQEVLAACFAHRQPDAAFPSREQRIRAKPEALAWARLHPGTPMPDILPAGVELGPPQLLPLDAAEGEPGPSYEFQLRLKTPEEREEAAAQNRAAFEKSQAAAEVRREEQRRLRERRWIYFVQVGAAGPVKIGCTRDVTKRISSLQTGHPERLVLLGCFEGTTRDERELHERFHAHRLTGEWFRPAPEILSQAAACNGVKS